MASKQISDISNELSALQARVNGSNGVIARLERAEEFLSKARDLLAQFSDDSASRALRLTSRALDQCRNASRGSLRSFFDTSAQLETILRSR